MELNDVLKEFIFDCEVKNYSEKTIKGYRNNNILFFNYLNKEFNITELESIKSMHIKKYFKFLMQKRCKSTYANAVLKTVRAFFKYCMEEEYLEENPCLKVGWQKEGKVIINTFTDKEIVNMLEAYKFTTYLEARNKMLIAFLIDTGARNNETCTLLKDDIKDKTIMLRGKGNKERQVSVSPLLKKYMMRLRKCIIQNDYLSDNKDYFSSILNDLKSNR